MTIADLAGPVLMQVLPTTVAVLLATTGAAALPLILPRFIAWLKAGDPAAAPHHTGHHDASGHHGGHHGAAHHAVHAIEHEHTYSI